MITIERVDRLLEGELASADFSFEIALELVAPFDGPAFPSTKRVEPRTKIYDADDSLFESPRGADRLLLKASERNRVIGYLMATPHWNGCASIDDFAVAGSHRRRGVGKLLMDEAVAWAVNAGHRAVRLETQSSNVPACLFYARYGFRLGGHDRYLYGQLAPDVRGEVALFWYLFLDAADASPSRDTER